MNVDIVILGAGQLDKLFESDVPCKAYLPLRGRSMGSYAAEVMKSCSKNGKVIFVKEPETILPDDIAEHADISCDGGKTIMESLANGVSKSDAEYIAAVPCDIPLVTKESFIDFMEKCMEKKSDFCYSYVRRSISEKKYPELRHTYVRLKEGTFCGGSFILMKRSEFSKGEKLFKTLSSARKNPLQLASAFGFLNIIKLLAGRLSIAELEKKAESLLGASVSAIESRYPEMAFNVDEPDDFERAKNELAGVK